VKVAYDSCLQSKQKACSTVSCIPTYFPSHHFPPKCFLWYNIMLYSNHIQTRQLHANGHASMMQQMLMLRKDNDCTSRPRSLVVRTPLLRISDGRSVQGNAEHVRLANCETEAGKTYRTTTDHTIRRLCVFPANAIHQRSRFRWSCIIHIDIFTLVGSLCHS
jgi:hypothetical protein